MVFLRLLKNGALFRLKMWEDDNPHARFWRKLIGQRAVALMRNREYLQTLRQNYEEAKRMQKLFGHVWAEYGTDIYQLTAEACGENWDFDCSDRDEEKTAFARSAEQKKEAAVKQKDDDLAATRQAGSRRGLDQLQGLSRERVRLGRRRRRAPRRQKPPKRSAARRRRKKRFLSKSRRNLLRKKNGAEDRRKPRPTYPRKTTKI